MEIRETSVEGKTMCVEISSGLAKAVTAVSHWMDLANLSNRILSQLI